MCDYKNKSIYYNVHNQIIIPTKEKNYLNNKKDLLKQPPNILIFVIDSMSYSNWQRTLPKTLNLLKNKYKSFIFKLFNKVYDNSFPNALAFLTG